MNTSLGPDTILVLNPHTAFSIYPERVVIESPDAVFTFVRRGAELVKRARFLLDGSHRLRDVSNRVGASHTELEETFRDLVNERALEDVTRLLDSETPEQFLSEYFPLCDFWARDIFSTRFWQAMLNGNATPELVLGWGFEFYHRVLGADEHNALSVNYCVDHQIREWLISHFAEECDHGQMFLDGMVASGFTIEQVAGSVPLPTSRALINYLDVLAVTDTIAYLGCYGVMHSPRAGQTRQRVGEQFDRFAQMYRFAQGLLEKIREHALLDLDLGHEGIVLERALTERIKVNRAVTSSILGAMMGIVRAFSCFFEGIYEYYSKPGVPLPRSSAF
ncbi:MAG: hypothetical protein AABN33_06675 [Acidobacteriota bacterium]